MKQNILTKLFMLPFLCAALLISTQSTTKAAGPASTNEVTLAWNYPALGSDPIDWPASFRFYSTTNAALPTSVWLEFTNIAAVVNGKVVTNLTVTIDVEKRFFYVVSSNAWWGKQSAPSNVAQSAAPPYQSDQLSIKSGR